MRSGQYYTFVCILCLHLIMAKLASEELEFWSALSRYRLAKEELELSMLLRVNSPCSLCESYEKLYR